MFEQIKYIERDSDYNVDEVAQFIEDGHLDGNVLLIIRGRHSTETCDKLKKRFEDIIASRGSNRGEDGFVKNQQVGSSQFHKNGAEYISDTIQNAHAVLELFSSLPPQTVRNLFLDDELEDSFARRGVIYRPSRHLSSFGNFATTRRWLNNGKMALHPHEDTAQLAFAEEDGFEVANGRHTIAANICIADDKEGSELVMWNLRPDNFLRKELNLEKTGYPYPIELADKYDRIKVSIKAGDLYYMNASYLHGVASSKSYHRISSGRFITPFDNKVVYWT